MSEPNELLDSARAASMQEFIKELQSVEAAEALSFLAQEWKRY